MNKQKKEVYSCQEKIKEKSDIIKAKIEKAGRFILATNVLEAEELESEKMLSEYKEQQSGERGFRFLKDPLFLADSVFVKNPKRVETMGFLMELCLLTYSIGQKMLRGTLQKKGGKLTNKPTLRWIFQVLQGIHLVVINGKKQLSNLTEEILEIL